MHVSELIDYDLLEREIEAGYITVRHHSTLPLQVLNYSDKAAFDRRWNEATLNCRGLILDRDHNIVARPWKKFFNLGEGFAEIDWDAPVEVTDKMDGSLGILYRYREGHKEWAGISTRGSFESDQAKHATNVWFDKYEGYLDRYYDHTFLFEIVYPNNRIVLNYGDLDDLVLLGAVHNEYGYYIGPHAAASMMRWTGPIVEVMEYSTLQDAFSNNDRRNKEGFVVRSGNKMVKLKQVDYIELHRIVTNLNERTVWERLGAGETALTICDNLPDEFHDFVKNTAEKLYAAQATRLEEILQEYLVATAKASAADRMFTRKDFAAVVSKSANRHYLFKMLDGDPIDELVWRELRPSVSKE